ncbi:GET complex subunit get1 [Entophlyctis luteolus]|nr:GET complex subunit get1 [Entophlyctis luteolus]KAJ3378307.1 GET complex subunit get1 [Entophlyctis sp. JEL0112]
MLVLVTVFLVAAVAALFDANYNAVAAALYTLFRYIVPLRASKQLAGAKTSLTEAKQSLHLISAQDDFAKWAKERRRHDKLEAEYASLGESGGTPFLVALLNEYTLPVKSISSDKASFVSSASWCLWGFVWFLQIAFIVHYLRTPMFFVPRSFVGPFLRALSMPFAPKGSVSVTFWLFSCKTSVKKIVGLFKPSLLAQEAVATTGEKLVKVE